MEHAVQLQKSCLERRQHDLSKLGRIFPVMHYLLCEAKDGVEAVTAGTSLEVAGGVTTEDVDFDFLGQLPIIMSSALNG